MRGISLFYGKFWLNEVAAMFDLLVCLVHCWENRVYFDVDYSITHKE